MRDNKRLLGSLITGLLTLPVGCFAFSPTSITPWRSSSPLFSTEIEDDAGMYQNVKGIIFDVDGTLADSWKLGFDATVVVLEKNGLDPITERIYHEHTVYCTPDRLARHAGLMPGDDDFESVGARLGKEFDDLYVGLVAEETAGFYPGIKDLLANLPSGVKLGVLTNAAVAYAHAVLEANDKEGGALKKRFASVHGADSVPEPKPAPDGILQVCKDLNLSPEDCVYIGDSPGDGKAAQAAGVPAIGVLWGSHKEDTLQNAPFSHLCRTVDELETLLTPTSVSTQQ